MTGGEASSQRGRVGFLASQTAGKVLRGAEWSLLHRQHQERCRTITPTLDIGLQFLRIVLAKLRPRVVPLGPQRSDITLMYTDAMWEPPKPAMLGFVVSSPRLRRPLAGWTVAPSALLEALVARK